MLNLNSLAITESIPPAYCYGRDVDHSMAKKGRKTPFCYLEVIFFNLLSLCRTRVGGGSKSQCHPATRCSEGTEITKAGSPAAPGSPELRDEGKPALSPSQGGARRSSSLASQRGLWWGRPKLRPTLLEAVLLSGGGFVTLAALEHLEPTAVPSERREGRTRRGSRWFLGCGREEGKEPASDNEGSPVRRSHRRRSGARATATAHLLPRRNADEVGAPRGGGTSGPGPAQVQPRSPRLEKQVLPEAAVTVFATAAGWGCACWSGAT